MRLLNWGLVKGKYSLPVVKNFFPQLLLETGVLFVVVQLVELNHWYSLLLHRLSKTVWVWPLRKHRILGRLRGGPLWPCGRQRSRRTSCWRERQVWASASWTIRHVLEALHRIHYNYTNTLELPQTRLPQHFIIMLTLVRSQRRSFSPLWSIQKAGIVVSQLCRFLSIQIMFGLNAFLNL